MKKAERKRCRNDENAPKPRQNREEHRNLMHLSLRDRRTMNMWLGVTEDHADKDAIEWRRS